ncbi:MAG: serine/threonine-protein kinase PknK [Kofleriaceae bacterium]
METAQHPATLVGGRFEVLDVLGEGGMGVVYRALDRDRGVQVAIKTLRDATPEDVLRFKTEFRALRDVRHPNLVELGELFESDDGWMFSMELVRGVPLLQWTSTDGDGGFATPSTQSVVTVVDGVNGEFSTEILTHGERGGLAALPPKCDPERTRQALGGLANALAALHRAGKVHRDVKPSNVVVDEAGRAVLLDFGVIAELRHARPHEAAMIIGTLSHMAPEQARGDTIGPAADWYAFGVVLFQAFAGRLPLIADNVRAMLEFKQRGTPPTLDTLVEGVPPELVRLCARLLERDPANRATEADVFEALGVARTVGPAWSTAATEGRLFVGRKSELAVLDRALEDSRAGVVYVEVEGESGVGKSALVDHFCELVRAQYRKATVLRGRCHQRELVAFNAFDNCMHDLARWMMARRANKVAPLVPRHVGDLLAVFPDLLAVPVFEAAALAAPALDAATGTDLRGRGFAALRELLVSLTVRGPVVLAIDDIQWADDDSLALLHELVQHRRAPPMLVVTTVRTGEKRPATPSARKITLGGLAPTDAKELLRHLVDDGEAVSTDTPIIAESAGHPLFLAELARHGSGVSLDDAIWLRVSALDPAAQRTLIAVAIATTPIPRELVVALAGLEPEAAEAALGTLAREQLVRLRGPHHGDLVEPFHDRVREAVLANEPAPLIRAAHRRLADLLVERDAPADAIFTHFDAARDTARASPYLLVAADTALRTYAFARAAELYRRALDLLVLTTEQRINLLARLADALANNGRTAEAADRYLEAAHLAPVASDRHLDLLRRAAERYLMGGRLVAGLATARAVLARISMTLPESRARTIAGVVWNQVRLRGALTWPPRPATAPPSVDADICFSISAGLSMVDPLVGAYFSGRAALLALRHGSTLQIARSMSSATVGAALLGRRERAARLFDATQRAATEDATPLSAWYVRLARTATTFVLDNDFRGCLALAPALETEWYALGRGPGWETDVARHFSLAAAQMLGQLHDFRTRLETIIDTARRTGDLFHEVSLRVRFAVRHLLADDPTRARDDVVDALASWLPSADSFGTQRAWALWSRTRIALYAGDLDRLEPDLEDEWQRMRRSLVARLPAMKVEWLHTYATYLLGRALAARSPREANALLREAEHTADELDALPFPVAPASALLVRAGIAHARGADVTAPLRGAIEAASAREFNIFVPFLRRRLGEAIGGTDGASMVRDANAAAAAMGFSNPARAAEMYPAGRYR